MADSSELFEAISHPTRIRILKTLEDHPTSFAALKRELSIDSSGNLDHHLKKLSGLVLVQRDGLYALTDDGKEALTSVKTIEIWKDVEDRRSKALADAPREVFILTILEFAVGVIATFNTAWLILSWRSWDINSFVFLIVYSFVTMMTIPSLLGLRKGRSASWTLMMFQSMLVLINNIFPLFYANYLWAKYFPLGMSFALLMVINSAILIIALKQRVREFFGKISTTPTPKRATMGSLLSLAVGLLEMFSGYLVVYGQFLSGKVSGGPGGGGVAFLYYFSIPTGLLISLSGILILLREYTLGGILLLLFGVTHAPMASHSVIMLLMGLPNPASSIAWNALSVILALALYVMPVAGGVLALTSRSRLTSK
jgi:DNA-binding HxlR family transcriptional regulator